ncbi:MAG: hypothetical protein AB7S77_18640 [Desulfatirhabdiaceae bacterium]
MKRIVDVMMQIEPGALNQVPVLIHEIRKMAGMPKDEFDRQMFQLAKDEIIYMDRHAYPGGVSPRQRDEFLIDHLGQVFVVAIFRKDAAEKIAVLDEAVDRMPVEPDQVQTDEPVRKPGKGGKRQGAGRKTGTRVVSDSEKRVKLNGVRIPSWLNDWLKSRGMAGELITQALIKQHGLTPPA